MIVRIITFSGFREGSSPLFKKLGLLDIYKLYTLLLGKFMFDLHHHNLPQSLSDFFQNVDHCHETRFKQGSNLYLPKMRTRTGQFAISYAGAKLWNNLPRNVKVSTSRNVFTHSLTQHLSNMYNIA